VSGEIAIPLRLTANNRTRSGQTERNDSVNQRYPKIAFHLALAGGFYDRNRKSLRTGICLGTSQR